MNIFEHNSAAWDRYSENGIEWSVPVSAEEIGGQISAGFLIAGFYEDWWTDEARLLNKYAPTFMATKAIKP